MDDIFQTISEFLSTGVMPVVLMLVRAVVAVMALYVVWRSYTSFRKGQRRRDPVIMLVDHARRAKFPVLYWENSIGRSKSCDIVLPDEAASRDHAVLMRREEGWIICDTGSKTGVEVNGRKIGVQKVLGIGDEITMGTTTLMLMNAEQTTVKKRKFFRGFSSEAASPMKLMMVTTLTHLLMSLQLCLAGAELSADPLITFGILALLGWGLYIFSFAILRRISFEIETVAFLLSGIGIIQLSAHAEVLMQIAALAIGMVLFSFMIWFMGDLKRVEKFHLYVGIAAILLFVINMIFGRAQYGAKNWIMIGPVSIQPSELIKIAFIFFGAGTLDKLQTKKNITEFLIFAVVCMAFLFLMKDLGTAVIFFACFLIISFMRSGSIRTIALSLTAAVLGVVLILTFMPHVTSRFDTWNRIWEAEFVNDRGFQQTRMLTYLASGGLFGVGLGKGHLSGVFAADSDIVFGMVGEEQGLLMGLVIVIAVAMFVLYARSDVTRSRSTFYSITACAAAGMLLFQLCLNVFGSSDIIPFTGVTLPFISSGGTSMMSVWGLMAFLKASDERTYAVKRMTKRQAREEEEERRLEEEREIKMRIRERQARSEPSGGRRYR